MLSWSQHGYWKMYKPGKRIMYWPEFSKDIERFVGNCETCAKFRNIQSNNPEKTFQKLRTH